MRRIRRITIGWIAGVLLAAPAAAQPALGIYPCSHIDLCTDHLDAVAAATKPSGVWPMLHGDFISLDALPNDPLPRLPDLLDASWTRGAVPVVNLMRSGPAAQLRNLVEPAVLEAWIAYFRMWSWAAAVREWGERGDGRYLHLIPWPEANGMWTNYHDTAGNFIAAFRKLRHIFALAGALQYTRFVWAPSDCCAWEPYYPGAPWIDVAGISSYSFGACDGGSDLRTYDQSIAPALAGLRAVAPGKPLLLAQTGVGRAAPEQREAWALAFFTRIRAEPNLLGALWFDRDDGKSQACHFELPLDVWRRVVRPLDRRAAEDLSGAPRDDRLAPDRGLSRPPTAIGQSPARRRERRPRPPSNRNRRPIEVMSVRATRPAF